MIVVLDTGGVDGIAPLDERRRARLRLLRERASDFVLPAAVLAEGVYSGHVAHDFHVNRLLALVRIAPVGETSGRAAGVLRQAAMAGGVDPPPSGVDAIVAAEADARAATDHVRIVTSDSDDFELLIALTTNVNRIDLLPA